MPRQLSISTPMSVLGFSAVDDELYRVLLRRSGTSVNRLSALRGTTRDELLASIAPLAAAGLVEVVDEAVFASSPDIALTRLISDETQRLRGVGEQLEALRKLMPGLASEYAAAQTVQGEPITVERVDGGDVAQLIRALSASSTGDLLWLRPDPWRIPKGDEINTLVKQLMLDGRRSRAIYPARALELAPDVVRGRTAAGEQVRVLAAVPCRLAIMGSTAALISEEFAVHDAGRLVIRQESMVSVLTLLFELLWERAIPVPGFDGSADVVDQQRQLLLQQLASGAKDEQIARTLGLSVRTVRRRVAELLEELGSESRFQAGVEAGRRGLV